MVNFISDAYSSFKYDNSPNLTNRKKAKSIFVAVLFFLIFIPLKSYPESHRKEDGKVKNIVIFFSLNAAVPGYQSFIEGFRSSFYEQNDEPYNLLIEYLDVGRFPDDEHSRNVVNLYNERFKEAKIDLVITVAPGTYELLKKLDLDALKTSPVINVELEKLSGNSKLHFPDSNVFEIKMKLDVEKTLRTARKSKNLEKSRFG